MLDLSQAEERVVAKALALLAEVEKPGERWGGATFQECITQHPIPNWSPIPPAWNREDGLPKKGVLAFEYRADDASASGSTASRAARARSAAGPKRTATLPRASGARARRARADELIAETQTRWTRHAETGRRQGRGSGVRLYPVCSCFLPPTGSGPLGRARGVP